MERRNRSIKALSELNYIDSLDSFEKADALVIWCQDYLITSKIEDFDLELEDLKRLEELFYKNLDFLKAHKEYTKDELQNLRKMKRFLKN
ncbi:hypothetical protein AFAEC_1988 [Aliarcobacter faecis]|uniref:hypothetical protein n=1 Tax=Aliarcobacter faecis TaxID=1564138 RepID=UPI000478C22E|nr:hypothetical protein [Aliarcobacter faecis]QKF74139.1 hypothetical protein AFAEC_1988 [Aliarcobacter faecis]